MLLVHYVLEAIRFLGFERIQNFIKPQRQSFMVWFEHTKRHHFILVLLMPLRKPTLTGYALIANEAYIMYACNGILLIMKAHEEGKLL